MCFLANTPYRNEFSVHYPSIRKFSKIVLCGMWLKSVPQRTSMNKHYTDVIMGAMASQITSITIVYSAVYSGTDPRKHQSSASLAFVRGVHRGPVNSPHKWPVTRKTFPFDDVIIKNANLFLDWKLLYLAVCSWKFGSRRPTDNKSL